MEASADLPFPVDVFVDSDCVSIFDNVLSSISSFSVFLTFNLKFNLRSPGLALEAANGNN